MLRDEDGERRHAVHRDRLRRVRGVWLRRVDATHFIAELLPKLQRLVTRRRVDASFRRSSVTPPSK